MDLYTSLFNRMEDLSTIFSSRMGQYEEDMQKLNNDTANHKTLSSLSKDFTDFKVFIWKTMAALKSQIELLSVCMDRHEMASRFKVLLLHGISEGNRASLVPSVLNIFSEKMSIGNVTTNDISSCYSLGRNTGKPRPVLIRLASRELRNKIWHNKTKLKGTGLTLSEFLTKPRHDVFTSARKYYGIKHCWTSDGRIVVQVAENSRRKIETAAELRELVAKYPPADTQAGLNTDSNSTCVPDKRTRRLAK